MTEKELSITLRELARADGLCDEWYGEWKDDSSIDECLDRYVRGFDFCVKHDYPSLDFIRKHFDKEMLHRYHIYLDEEVTVETWGGYYIFLGKCRATVSVGGIQAVSIYCRHDSEVDVFASAGSRVFVTYYENSHGVCESEDGCYLKRYNR